MAEFDGVGTDARKDNSGVQALLGVVIPSTLLVYTLYCLATGSVYFPKATGAGLAKVRFEWTEDRLRFGMAVSLQIATSLALVSWFFCANKKSLEHLTTAGLLAAVIVSAGGILVTVVRVLIS